MVIEAIIVEAAKAGDAERLSHTHIKRVPKDHEIPHHYQLDPEPIDVIRSWGLDFCLGNVAKWTNENTGEEKNLSEHEGVIPGEF